MFPRYFNLIVKLLLLMVLSTAAQAEDQPGVGGDFTLTNTDSTPFHLSDIRGEVAVLFFGFTHCPDVCPNTLYEIKRLLVSLGDQADQVKVLFVSVDTERDTPEILSDYVAYFDSRMIGLTGSKAEIDSLLNKYHAKASVTKIAGDYHVEHSANLFLINRQGALVSIVLPRTPFSVLQQQVKKLITESTR